MYRYTKLAILVLAIAETSVVSYAAATARENDATNISQANISIVQAIVSAEQHVNGKASRAEYETSKDGPIYDVEVVSAGKVFDIRIDAKNGAVISSAQDEMDHDDDHDPED